MKRLPALSAWHLGPSLLALLLLAAVFALYVLQEKRIDTENRRRQASLQLVDTLRQSSDDLTRMARTLVLTGDARYWHAFEAIGAIRDGRQPWPAGYEGVYWDLVLAGERAPGAPGLAKPLLERMREAGFSDAEFALLAQAKRESDLLKEIEYQAMALAADTPVGSPQRAQAMAMLHDSRYHAAKARIMAPIDAVLRSVGERTEGAVEQAVQRARWARAGLIALALALGALLLRQQLRLRRLMGGSVEEVHERLGRLAGGHFGDPPPPQTVPPASVLGHLLQTAGALQNLEAERRVAQQSLQFAASVFSHAREGIVITDAQGLIVDVNEAFCRTSGYPRAELLGRSPRLLDSGQHEPGFFDEMMVALARDDQWQGEVWDRRKDGGLFVSLQTISAVRDARGEITHCVSLMTDITALKEQARRLEQSAHYDALTGLPNRVLLGERLQHAMVMAPRHGLRIAVAYLDLDGFKAVNDRFGHQAGDRLLVQLAQRLRGVLREGDTLARLGGDEFVAVLLDLPDEATCETLLARMLRELALPQPLGEGQPVQVSGSIGVAWFPQPEPVDADQLLRQADQAMFQAKLAGKNRYQVFDTAQAAELRGRLQQLAGVEDLRRALHSGELRLHYQPKLRLRDGLLVGVEALLRWQHPQRGLLSPAQFLGIVEDQPLIVELGDWVLKTALAQLAAWRAQGLPAFGVSVNLAARQLQQSHFVAHVLGLLALHPELQPGDLSLELLESSALDDLPGVSRQLAEGAAAGLRFALDDFGTGYSSLTYLRRLPAAELKIDQSFVRDMLDDADDLAILDGVIGLAAAFRRRVTAEGVESIEHGSVLLQLGCEQAQGYGIARPMPPEQLPDWLAAWRTPPEWLQLRPLGADELPLLRARLDRQARASALRRHLLGERDPPSPALSDRLLDWLSQHPARAPLEPLWRQAQAERQRLLLRRRQGPLPAEALQDWDRAEHALLSALSASVETP